MDCAFRVHSPGICQLLAIHSAIRAVDFKIRRATSKGDTRLKNVLESSCITCEADSCRPGDELNYQVAPVVICSPSKKVITCIGPITIRL